MNQQGQSGRGGLSSDHILELTFRSRHSRIQLIDQRGCLFVNTSSGFAANLAYIVKVENKKKEVQLSLASKYNNNLH